ncbi:MAG: ABC transporter permease [Bacteroidia bacterium]|nr:ABC transporter permease [Bacteroidia bacterium]MCC6767847.1 ABC transporter permease [Bacteroidia bacterium]
MLRQGGDKSRISGPVVRISIGAIAISLAVMIISVAIVTGFQQAIRAKVIGFGAHIQLSNFDSNHSLESKPIERDAALEQKLLQNPEIKHLQVFSVKPGIIKSSGAIEGLLFKGIDKQYDTSFLKKHLVKGRLPVFEDTSKSAEVLISATQARLLHLAVDSSFVMYFVQDPPKARKFRVAGIYDTGLGENDFDRLYIWGDVRVVNGLARWEPGQVSGYEISLHNLEHLAETEAWVYEQIPQEWNSETIGMRYPQIFSWLELMDTNVMIIIALMLVVSVVNMVTCLLILILEKARMVGILKVLGADNRRVAGIFLRQSSVMILGGMLIGNILAFLLCYIQIETGMITLNKETYYLSVVPIHIDWLHVLLINALTFVISYLSLLLPVYIVSGIRPARVIRFD